MVVDAAGAELSFTGTRLEAAGTADHGIHLQGGKLTMVDSEVLGVTGIGLYLTTMFPPIGFARASFIENQDTVTASFDGVDIDGPGDGIVLSGDGDGDRLTMRRSHVRGKLVALDLGEFNVVDLGTPASPGDNRLEAAAGGVALRDHRLQAGPSIDAHGTQLNGTTPTGDVLGPVESAPAFKIAGPNTIRF
jgi:hypothetical protein